MIGSGGQVVASGSPSIVVTDGRWQNDGAFTPATSLVRIEGTATTANSTISGTATTAFYNLTQQKSANDVLLSQNISVDNNFTMAGGLFELNTFLVTLGTATGQIVGETETNRITGITGGEIIKTLTLNAPAAVNAGNLGAEITSAVNMGSTTIRRGHVQQTDGASGLSIHRYYDIIPTTNSGLGATLRQYYFDAELAGRVESELEHYNSLNNVAWYYRNFTSRNTTSNFVENSGYDDFSNRWTLASPINQPLPVTFIDEGIRCETDNATLFWTVIESQGSDYFQVQRSANEVEWTDVPDGRIPSQGIGRNRYNFALTESANFFRVRQVDLGGKTELSKSHRLTCNVAGAWSIWPNPASTTLNIKAPFGQAIRSMEVTDLLGQVVLSQSLTTEDVTVAELAFGGKLSAAMYLLKITPLTGKPIVKRFEVGM